TLGSGSAAMGAGALGTDLPALPSYAAIATPTTATFPVVKQGQRNSNVTHVLARGGPQGCREGHGAPEGWRCCPTTFRPGGGRQVPCRRRPPAMIWSVRAGLPKGVIVAGTRRPERGAPDDPDPGGPACADATCSRCPP